MGKQDLGSFYDYELKATPETGTKKKPKKHYPTLCLPTEIKGEIGDKVKITLECEITGLEKRKNKSGAKIETNLEVRSLVTKDSRKGDLQEQIEDEL